MDMKRIAAHRHRGERTQFFVGCGSILEIHHCESRWRSPLPLVFGLSCPPPNLGVAIAIYFPRGIIFHGFKRTAASQLRENSGV